MLIVTSRQEVNREAAFGLTVPRGGAPIYLHEPYEFVLPNQWKSRPSDRGKVGGRSPDPEITEAPGLQKKKNFLPFGPQYGLQIRRGAWVCHC